MAKLNFDLKLVFGDITKYKTDIIVNSANRTLMRGSGVCGAIHATSGVELEKECMKRKKELNIDVLGVGEILVTKAYNLPHSYVIHTVGPKKGVDDISLLLNCYINSLREADRLNARSISFPAISTGIYGVSLEYSAKIVKRAIFECEGFNSLKKVYLFFVKKEDILIYSRIFGEDV